MKKNYVSGTYAYKVDIGKVRLSNEDRAVALTNTRGNILMLVCDGMGGANKGDYASSIAARIFSDSFMEKQRFYSRFSAIRWIYKVAKEANKQIFRESSSSETYKGMGTTLTLVLLINDYMIVGQIGDSRAYRLSNNKLEQLTEDQTYVSFLYRTGKITKEEMKTHPKRHVLSNALGVFPHLDIDLKIHNYHNENILVCSDGLFNNVEENNIESILCGNDSAEQKANELISLANNSGGSDNIAVIVWEANK